MLAFRPLGLLISCVVGALSFAGCSSDEPGSDAEESCTHGTRCTMDDDCGNGMRCNGTSCTRVLCLKRGEACEIDDLCAEGACVDAGASSICWSGSRPEGYGCTESSQCASGLECNGGSGRCATPGAAGIGESCGVDADCASNLCRTCGPPDAWGCVNPGNAGDNCCPSSEVGHGCAAGLLCRRTMGCSLTPSPLTVLSYYQCLSPAAEGEFCCFASDCQSLTCSLERCTL